MCVTKFSLKSSRSKKKLPLEKDRKSYNNTNHLQICLEIQTSEGMVPLGFMGTQLMPPETPRTPQQ